MRTRIIAAAVVLALGFVGITLAQKPGAQPNPPAAEKAVLRAQVVQLRVEIELLQLDHEADREILFAWMKAERTGTGGLAGMAVEMMLASMGGTETKKAIEEGEKLIAKAKEKGEDAEAISQQVMAKAVKTQIDAMKKNFTNQATELAGKRLQLDAVEKQYLEAE